MIGLFVDKGVQDGILVGALGLLVETVGVKVTVEDDGASEGLLVLYCLLSTEGN